jgi:hypothetical protein
VTDAIERKARQIRLKRISHVAIGVSDIGRQAEFYVRMSGLHTVDRMSQHVYLRAAGMRGFRWLLNVLPVISKLSLPRPSAPSQRRAPVPSASS